VNTQPFELDVLEADMSEWPEEAKAYIQFNNNKHGQTLRFWALKLAKMGLLPKWSWAQTPDIRAIRAGCSLLEQGRGENDFQQTARDFVILFGLRGHIGVS
jgi:hypothetical protein